MIGGRHAGDRPAAEIDLRRRGLSAGLAAMAVVAALGSRPARGSCTIPQRRRLDYELRVSGLQIAEMALEFSCAGSFAIVELQLVNRGVATFFAGRNRTSMTARIGFDADGRPQPTHFRASYQKPDRLRETELRFAPDGELTRLVTRNQGREQESPVPPELREPSIDPLAAIMCLSYWLGERAAPGDHILYPVFEGRKRADLEAIYRGPTRVDAAGRSWDAHHLEASLRGLSGFDEKDSFVTLPGEKRDWIDVFVSDDPLPVPLLISNTASRLPSRIELTSG